MRGFPKVTTHLLENITTNRGAWLEAPEDGMDQDDGDAFEEYLRAELGDDLAGVIGNDRLAVMVSSRGKTLEGLTSALQTGSRDAGFRDARDAVVVAMAVVVLAATSRAGADSDSDEDEDAEDGADGEDAQAGRAAQRDGFGD